MKEVNRHPLKKAADKATIPYHPIPLCLNDLIALQPNKKGEILGGGVTSLSFPLPR